MNPDSRTTEALCGEWTYEIVDSADQPVDPAVFAVDSTDQKLTVYTENFDKPGTYNLKFKGWHKDWPLKFGEQAFVVTVVDVCPASTLDYAGSNPEDNKTYIASQGLVTFKHSAFADLTSKCGPIVLSAGY